MADGAVTAAVVHVAAGEPERLARIVPRPACHGCHLHMRPRRPVSVPRTSRRYLMFMMMAMAASCPAVAIIICAPSIAVERCGWMHGLPIRPTHGFRIRQGLGIGHSMTGGCGMQIVGGIRQGLGHGAGNPHGVLIETWNELMDMPAQLMLISSARALPLNASNTTDNNKTDLFIPTSLYKTMTFHPAEAQPHHEACPPGQTFSEAQHSKNVPSEVVTAAARQPYRWQAQQQ